MNRAQVVDLLTYAAACDQRTVGDTDVLVWFDMLAPLDFQAALAAMRQHYRRQPDVRLKPGHLWQMCISRTDGDAAEAALMPPCNQGTYCPRCKLIHHDHEPCSVLEAREFPRAIESLARRISDLAEPAGPESRASADELEAERSRQIAALQPLLAGDQS